MTRFSGRPFSRSIGAVSLLAVLACGRADDPKESRSIRQVRETGSCPECSIELREVVRLGADDDPASIRPDVSNWPCMVAQLSDHTWAVSGLVGGGELAVYDSTGALVRTIGRSGRGPGEYGTNLHVVVGPEERVSVIDNSYLRVTVLHDAQPLRTIGLTRRIQSLALLEGGKLLVHGRPLDASDTGHPFTLVDVEAGELLSFGERDEDLGDLDQWVVGSGYKGGFWAASGWKYQLHRWANADSLEYTLVRDNVEWFPLDNAYSDDMYVSEPPSSWFSHMWETQGGLLWTFSLIPDENWSPEPPQLSSPAWNERVFDTMIEVIETAAGEVLAQLRFENTLAPVCGNEMMYTAEETELGDVRVVVFEPRLVR